MIPRSAAFDAAVIQSHMPELRGEVLDPAGVVLFGLNIDGGTQTTDRSGSQRRMAEWTVRGSLREMVPSNFDPKILLPYGTEVRLMRGIADLEMIPLGTFRLTQVETDVTLEDGIGVRFQGADRSERLSRELIAGFDAAANSKYDDVIAHLLQQAWQGASTTVSQVPLRITGTESVTHPGGYLTPTLHFEAKTNAWEEAARMATACGRELFVDYDGVVTFEKVPTLDNSPVWNFVDGPTDTRVRLGRRYSSANTPNYITVNGSGSGAADRDVVGVAFVADPSTSIDINGAYGTVPKWIDSVYATSNEQAEDEARAELAKVLMGTDTLEIDAVPHPALDAGDVVTVTAELLDIFEQLYIVNTVTIPFDVTTPMRVSLGRG